MADHTETQIQVLRTIDKLDKVGLEGVEKLLTTGLMDASGSFIPGCGLDPIQTHLLMGFLATKADTNEATLKAMSAWFDHAQQVRSRVDMMVFLEDTDIGHGRTAWDRLLETRTNADETWSEGGRPANIAWVLDDLIKAARQKAVS